jgi:hypothetical protein
MLSCAPQLIMQSVLRNAVGSRSLRLDRRIGDIFWKWLRLGKCCSSINRRDCVSKQSLSQTGFGAFYFPQTCADCRLWPSADMSGDALLCCTSPLACWDPPDHKKSFRREPISILHVCYLGWVGVLPSIAPSVLDAQARRSHLMPVYGVIGQKVARVEQVVTVSSSCQGEYHHE